MYRKFARENETEEDSVTNLGGQEKEWVLGNEGANSDGFCLDETRKVGVLLDMERQVLPEMPGRSGRE